MRVLAVIAALIAASACGCTSAYYRSLDGVSASIAVALPDEELLKIQALEYLSGSKVVVRDPSEVTQTFESTSANSYMFGLIETAESRKNTVTARPK